MNFGEAFMRSMSQMTDQRVARVSTIVIPFDTEKTLDEAYACFEAWKVEIGSDEEKFAEVARRESEDPASAPSGGDLGYVTRARQLPPQLDDVVFRDQKPGQEQTGVCTSPFCAAHLRLRLLSPVCATLALTSAQMAQ
jgi:peptidyl-prolyl cis-trans isomerase D